MAVDCSYIIAYYLRIRVKGLSRYNQTRFLEYPIEKYWRLIFPPKRDQCWHRDITCPA